MEPKTRQTLIGVAGQVAILSLALMEGYDGMVTLGGVMAIGATVTPELAEKWPPWSSK